jgi:capsular polysaccharide biosynthesis protein
MDIADLAPAEDFDVTNLDLAKKTGTYVFGGFVRVHFGHFLVECLGPLWTLDAVEEPIDGVLFMPYHANPNETLRNIRLLDDHSGRWLKALGVDEKIEIIRQPTQVEKLVLGENGLGLSERFRGSSWFQDFARRRNAHYRKAKPPKANTSIYVTRTKLSGRKGGILGETALENTFRNAGYQIFAPEKHSLEDQLATYASAKRIVAVEGSALHLPPFVIDNDCRIAVLSRRSGIDKIASEFGEQYSGFVGVDLDIIDTAKDHWVPAGQPRTNLESYAVVDFDETYDQLITLGYLPETVRRSIPSPLDVTNQIKEIAKARKQHPTVLNWDKDAPETVPQSD